MSADLRVRRNQAEEGTIMDVIAVHIKKEAYLHHRLTSEMNLRKMMTKKLQEENSDVKEKSKRVIELLKDKLNRAESNVAVYRRRMTVLEERLKASNPRERAITNATNGEVKRKALQDIDTQLPRHNASPYKSPLAVHSYSTASTQISKSISFEEEDIKQSNLVQSIDEYRLQVEEERNIDAVEEELHSLSAAKRTISKLTAVINDLSLRRSDHLSMSMVETSHHIMKEEEELLEEQPMEDNRLDLTDCIRELDAFDLVVSDTTTTSSPPQKNTNTNTTNISSEMEQDIAGIALGMELTHYKSMVVDLTTEMEAMREESKVRAMQSIERIKQLKSKLSISSQALVEANHRIASLEHELVEKSQAVEHYSVAMHKYECELEEVRSAATAHHSEIDRLRDQMQRERDRFIKLRKSLSRIDSLQASVFSSSSAQSSSSTSSTTNNLPTDQIKEIYHLGLEQGTKKVLLEQEELCRRQYAEFQSIQLGLREKLAVLQLENIQLKQLRDRVDMQAIRPELLSRRLDELQRELEHNITECVLTNNQLLSLQDDYSIVTLNQALKEKDEELAILQNQVISLESQMKEISYIQSVQKEPLPSTTSTSTISLDPNIEKRFDQALRTIKDLEKRNQLLMKERDQLGVELNRMRDDHSSSSNSSSHPVAMDQRTRKKTPLRDRHIDGGRGAISSNNNNNENNENINKQQHHQYQQHQYHHHDDVSSLTLPQLRQAFHAMMTSNNTNDVNCHCDFICKLLDMPALDEHTVRRAVAHLAPSIIASSQQTSWHGINISTEPKTNLPTLLKSSKHSSSGNVISENEHYVSAIPNRELWI